MPDPIYTGSAGLPLRLTLFDDGVLHDPATATVREITIVKPDHTRIVKESADVSVATDSDGRACIEYITDAADLDLPGPYRVQGYLEDAAGSWPTAILKFSVIKSIRVEEVP